MEYPEIFTDPTEQEQTVIKAFARFCESDLAAELDPGNELDWHSLTVGFFLARLPKHPRDRLIDLCSYVRYQLGIG